MRTCGPDKSSKHYCKKQINTEIHYFFHPKKCVCVGGGGTSDILSPAAKSVCVCVCVGGGGGGHVLTVPHQKTPMFRFMYMCMFSLSLQPIELFLVPASAPRLVKQRPWYVLSCLWDGAYKRTLAVNRKE